MHTPRSRALTLFPVQRAARGSSLETLESRIAPAVAVNLTGAAPNLAVTFSDSDVPLIDNAIVARVNAGLVEWSLNGGVFTADLNTSLAGTQSALIANVQNITADLGSGIDAFSFISNLSISGSLAVNAESVTISSSVVAPAGATITTDTLNLETGTLTSALSTITVQPSTAGRAINIGGDDPSQLSISSAEMQRIFATTLIIGNTTAGNVTITGAVAPASANVLFLRSGGIISDDPAGSITVTGLAAEGVLGVNLDATGSAFASLEARTTTGDITVVHSGNLSVGGVTAGLTGIAIGTSGNITITNAGSVILVDANGTATIQGGGTSGNLIITANGDISDVLSTVDQDAITMPAGSISITAGRDILFGASGGNFDNDVRAGTSITFTAARDVLIDGFSDISSDDFALSSVGALTVTAGRNIEIRNVLGNDASMGASGNDDSSVSLTAATVILNAASAGALFSVSGDVVVTTDRMIIGATSGITANAGLVDIRQRSEDWTLVIGPTTDVADASLELSLAEIGKITSSALRLGDAENDGGVQIAAAFTVPLNETWTLAGRVTFAPATPFTVTLNSTVPISGHTQLKIDGTIDFSNATFSGALGFIPADGDQFVIVSNEGTATGFVPFRGVPEGSLLFFGDRNFLISYEGGDGNDVVLTRAEQKLAIATGDKSAIYRDIDGDLVTIKTTRGSFNSGDFTVAEVPGGAIVARINVGDDGTEFAGANLTISAKRGISGGNGLVNIGFIDATNVDLGVVVVAGDLGRIIAGDGDAARPAVKSLTVQSLGALDLTTQFGLGDLISNFAGKLPKLTVKSDFRGASVLATDSIGAITVGGSVTGGRIGTGADLGSLSVKGSIGSFFGPSFEITAFGKAVAPVNGTDLAIRSITVGASVERMNITAGVDLTGLIFNADASIGSIKVAGDWRASNARAGVGAGLDGFIGTQDDAKFASPLRDRPNAVSSIGSVQIKGQALGTGSFPFDNFGIVAELIANARVAGSKLVFAKGAHSATDFFYAAPTAPGAGSPLSDFIIAEVLG